MPQHKPGCQGGGGGAGGVGGGGGGVLFTPKDDHTLGMEMCRRSSLPTGDKTRGGGDVVMVWRWW